MFWQFKAALSSLGRPSLRLAEEALEAEHKALHHHHH